MSEQERAQERYCLFFFFFFCCCCCCCVVGLLLCVVKSTLGKRNMTVEEYRKLCHESLVSTSDSVVTEAHLLLVLLWNLCARSDTGSAIHSRHIDWEHDCLRIGIAKSKRFAAEKAVYYGAYANPYDPQVSSRCPLEPFCFVGIIWDSIKLGCRFVLFQLWLYTWQ